MILWRHWWPRKKFGTWFYVVVVLLLLNATLTWGGMVKEVKKNDNWERLWRKNEATTCNGQGGHFSFFFGSFILANNPGLKVKHCTSHVYMYTDYVKECGVNNKQRMMMMVWTTVTAQLQVAVVVVVVVVVTLLLTNHCYYSSSYLLLFLFFLPCLTSWWYYMRDFLCVTVVEKLLTSRDDTLSIFDVCSLALYGTQALPIRLKIVIVSKLFLYPLIFLFDHDEASLLILWYFLQLTFHRRDSSRLLVRIILTKYYGVLVGPLMT